MTKSFEKIENKLILLYLMDKIDIPMSKSQITDFAVSCGYMDYFSVQTCLEEMVTVGYLDESQENNITRYTLTDEGLTSLEYFVDQMPHSTKNDINQYVMDNQKEIKRDFEVTANYFYNHINNDYTVKCGVYEDKSILMEVNISVVTKEQARNICGNWKNNVHLLYGNILDELTAFINIDPKN